MHAYDLIDFTFDGDFFKYYTRVMEKAEAGQYLKNGLIDGANYNIVNYIILAVPLLPIYVLSNIIKSMDIVSVCLIVENIFLMLCVIYSSKLVFELCEKLGFSKEKSKIIAYMYLTSPLLIFTTTEFGQVDIFQIIFILPALKKYIDKKYYSFSILISFAISLKLFALLLFLPLILFAEKNIVKIIKYTITALSVTLFTRFMFLFDNGYSVTKEYMNNNYGFMGKILNSGQNLGIGTISYFVVAFIFICICAYIISPREDSSLKIASVYIPLIVFSSFTLLVKWHPQWLSILVPFMTIVYFIHRENRILSYLEIFISITILLIINFKFGRNVDVYMVNGGLLPMIFGSVYNSSSFAEIIDSTKIISSEELSIISYSILTACMILFCVIPGIRIIKKEPICTSELSVKREYTILRPSILLILNLFYLTLYFTRSFQTIKILAARE